MADCCIAYETPRMVRVYNVKIGLVRMVIHLIRFEISFYSKVCIVPVTSINPTFGLNLRRGLRHLAGEGLPGIHPRGVQCDHQAQRDCKGAKW